MSALNSFHHAREHTFPDTNKCLMVQDERIIGQKGMVIIPYRPNQVLAAMYCYFEVFATTNESRSLWTNPEIGFYGYVHARRNKQGIGSPSQLNQRWQMFYSWHNHEQWTQFETLVTLRNLGSELGLVNLQFDWFVPSPLVTDFSFGMQREGRFRILIEQYYWNPLVFVENEINPPSQILPDPSQIEAIDPAPYQDLFDPGTPISPPYTGDDDFGENTPEEGTPPFEPLPEGSYTIVWSTSWVIEATNTPQQAGNQPGQSPGLTGPVEYVGPPVFSDAERSITHEYVDLIGSGTALTFFGSAVESEWNAQKANYQWSVEPWPEP